MNTSLDEIYSKAKLLPAEDRASLAARLLEDLDGPVDEGVEEAWKVEIDRRIAAYERGEVKAVAAGDVLRRIEARKGS